jgi:hypothetical protein
MPIEAALLRDKIVHLDTCPKCGAVFEPFLRGQVQRSPRRWIFFGKPRPYCALICRVCKEIVGYE